jgi:DNA-binding response OmpR family regulator
MSRRVTPGSNGMYRYQSLEVEFLARRAQLDGYDVPLTRREFEVLVFLARNAGKVLLHRQVLQAVWGTCSPKPESAISCRLRRAMLS